MLDMSRRALTIIGLLAIICFVSCVSVQAEEAQNKTLYWSPVTIENGSPAFTIEDAQGINYTIYDELGAQSVHVSVIIAQLYLNGAPYRMAGIPITFSSDNDSVAVLEPNRTRPSDANGQARILLIARNHSGWVNITAESEIMYGHRLSDTCRVRVVGWGTVSGMVTDQNKNGVPDATVTLWIWNGTANVKMLAARDNPQLSNDGRTAAIGTYTFVYVPVGSYNVTAEKDGHVYYRLVSLHEGQGTVTANVAIPDYVYVKPATPTPEPSATPTSMPSSSPKPTPALPALFAIAAFGAIAMLKRRPE
ncbi:carboxypeptidase-like regulatory domain-containing protein [Methanocella conradii]|uniref:carboxypeptidase-like regulatory domain-containing protein n=1 Tax=Methanocella conradii TaxID=1175444 RepID=UPI0020C5FAB8|nr:carboxypeptidase-like regulatory domain-containing protein [Methanocella conradii]